MFTCCDCTFQSFQKDIFYWNPLGRIPDEADQLWYGANIVGHNMLDHYLKRMLEAADIDVTNKTNHSFRATAITRMMEKSVPAKLIMEHSGHLSGSGLSSYERSTPLHRAAMSRFLIDITTSKSNSAVMEASYLSCEEKTLVPALKESTPGADHVPEEKQNPSELMKNLQFHNMQGCTFNISFKA